MIMEIIIEMIIRLSMDLIQHCTHVEIIMTIITKKIPSEMGVAPHYKPFDL